MFDSVNELIRAFSELQGLWPKIIMAIGGVVTSCSALLKVFEVISKTVWPFNSKNVVWDDKFIARAWKPIRFLISILALNPGNSEKK